MNPAHPQIRLKARKKKDMEFTESDDKSCAFQNQRLNGGQWSAAGLKNSYWVEIQGLDRETFRIDRPSKVSNRVWAS